MTQFNSHRQNLTRRLTFVLSLLGCIVALVLSQPAAACGPTPVGDHCSDAGHPINLITGNKFRREVDLPALPGELGLEIVRYYNSSDAVAGRPGLNGLTGRGWRLSYEYSLNQGNHQVVLREPDGVTHNFMQGIVDPERYLPLDPALGYLSFRDVRGGREFIWHKTNGYQISFNRFGWTDAIDAPSGAHLGLLYSPDGRLISLTDPQGRSLYFNYPDKASVWNDNAYDGVVSIDSPVGRFVYHYGSEHIKVDKSSIIPEWRVANLIQVDYPTYYDPDQKQHAFANRGVTTSSINRQYHYEDKRFPSFLTGISIHGRGSDGQQIDRRIGTYEYDERGRGILTVLGEPARWQEDSKGKTGSTKTLVPGTGIEQLTIDRSDPKVIVITNSLGQTSRIRFAEIGGEYRILELRGPGCSTCGLSNVRYEYDDMGRRLAILRLDDEGKVVDGERTSYDPLGRIIRITHETYRDHAEQKQNSKQNGKARESKLISSQLLQRFEYAPDSYQPNLIARPSVVNGQEQQIRITYNSAGQPTAITETGYEPIHAQMMSRSTTYRYQLINNISVLTEIDGPLANGPKNSPEDSDITKLVWDARGRYIIQRIEPGNLVVSLSYDQAGRIKEKVFNDGFRQRQTRFAYSQIATVALEPETVSQTAWLLNNGKIDTASQTGLQDWHASFNALGQQTRITDHAGRISHILYDAEGRRLGVADAQGNRSLNTLDAEGKTVRSALYRPGADDHTPYRAAYQWYDEAGRLTQRLLPDGRLDTWRYGVDGTLQTHTDGDAIRTLHLSGTNQSLSLQQTPDGWLRASISPPFNTQQDNNEALTRQRKDDFGRVIWQALADHGNKTATYDAANHLTSITNADGSSVHYVWDHAGHLLQKRYLDAKAALLSKTDLSYQGQVLSRAIDPQQTTDYRYDALARPIAEQMTLQGLATPYTTMTRYDSHGLITARILADGRVLRTHRTDVAHGASTDRLLLQRPAVAWIEDQIDRLFGERAAQLAEKILPSQTIASNITIDPFNGLSAYKVGNGIQTNKTFDLAGRLTTLHIDHVQDLQYDYGVGPRITAIKTAPTNKSSALIKTDYHYQGFGRLQLAMPIQVDGKDRKAETDNTTNNVTNSATHYDQLGRTTDDGSYRYTYTPAGQIEHVHDQQNKLIATYRYNSLQQRISKTVQSKTTYFLWQQNQLVAEINADGKISTQYLYFNEGQHSTPIAKLDADDTYFIHTDHHAAPIAMTDANQHIVWKANISEWGRVTFDQNESTNKKHSREHKQVTLNIRLPGQYYDEETGLHDNWHRTYNPGTGRYLQPDPIGYRDGPDAYLYAQGDPLNKIDPTGLYQSDIHYYMTFFLAMAAGVSFEDARTIALAAQYVDDNPITRPLDSSTWYTKVGSIFVNQERLRDYHFVLSDANGKTIDSYNNSDLNQPGVSPSPQLSNLLNASLNAPTTCGRLQFFGEYLHAFEDTFSHRNKDNKPYDAEKFEMGIGHGFDLSNPDYTYDDANGWNMRSARTLAMEEQVFNTLLAKYGDPAAAKNWHDIQAVVTKFNAIQESEESEGAIKFQKKFELLDQKLSEWGYQATNTDGSKRAIDLFSKEDKYDPELGKQNRNRNLCDKDGNRLKKSDYPGTILPESACPK